MMKKQLCKSAVNEFWGKYYDSKPTKGKEVWTMLVVDEEKCIGCALCNAFCPVEALVAWGVNHVDMSRCTECLECIPYCPVDALEVK